MVYFGTFNACGDGIFLKHFSACGDGIFWNI